MNMTEDRCYDYSKRKNDPEYLLELIDKYVKVQLILDISFTGFINTIDPVTHSIVLSVPKDGKFQTTLIPGEAIVEVYEITPSLPPPPKKENSIDSENNVIERKKKLMEWFKFNLLPVMEYKDKILVQSVHVLPPYKVSNIYAENPVIALQIRKIIERMPHNFKSD